MPSPMSSSDVDVSQGVVSTFWTYMYVITFTIDRENKNCEYVVSDKLAQGLRVQLQRTGLVVTHTFRLRYFKTAQPPPPPKRCTVRTLPKERLPQQRK